MRGEQHQVVVTRPYARRVCRRVEGVERGPRGGFGIWRECRPLDSDPHLLDPKRPKHRERRADGLRRAVQQVLVVLEDRDLAVASARERGEQPHDQARSQAGREQTPAEAPHQPAPDPPSSDCACAIAPDRRLVFAVQDSAPCAVQSTPVLADAAGAHRGRAAARTRDCPAAAASRRAALRERPIRRQASCRSQRARAAVRSRADHGSQRLWRRRARRLRCRGSERPPRQSRRWMIAAAARSASRSGAPARRSRQDRRSARAGGRAAQWRRGDRSPVPAVRARRAIPRTAAQGLRSRGRTRSSRPPS